MEPAETRTRLREAMERRDHAAVVSLFAPDVVLHSPIIGEPFEGREAVGRLIAAVIDGFGDFHYTAEADGGDEQVLAFAATVRRRKIDGVDILRFDSEGRVNDITVLIRPMAGLAAVAAALGPRLARSPIHGLLIAVVAAPLSVVLGLIHRVTPSLIKRR